MAQVGGVTTDWLLYGDRPLRRMVVQRGAAWAEAIALLRTAWRDPERRAVAVAVLRALQAR
jgi:hypothetical protein